MRVLWNGTDGASRSRVLLFGTGLIGSSIATALGQSACPGQRTLPYDWHDAGRRQDQIEAIIADTRAGNPARIDTIWAGGSSGFGSGEDAMNEEELRFREVLELAARLRDSMPESAHCFHMISSAGGLFEGQTQCTAATIPHPIRPYGAGKSAQEALLRASGMPGWAIYRPSSVYGYTSGGRSGLITTLIRNALRMRTTRLFGSPDTVRDYVLATDIGRFVAARIETGPVRPGMIHLLASGRPMTMIEVLGTLEDALGAPLMVQYDPYPDNARNMSFLPSALPSNWIPTPVLTGIRQTLVTMKSRLHGVEA